MLFVLLGKRFRSVTSDIIPRTADYLRQPASCFPGREHWGIIPQPATAMYIFAKVQWHLFEKSTHVVTHLYTHTKINNLIFDKPFQKKKFPRAWLQNSLPVLRIVLLLGSLYV